MGANRKLATPEAYPAAFLTAIREGGGIIFAEHMPWTTISAAKRFRLCLALIKSQPTHPLYPFAIRRWSVTAGHRALEITVAEGQGELPPSIGAALIGRALSIDKQ